MLTLLLTAKTQKFFKADHAGITFIATDIDWSSGTGPTVTGSAADLALVLAKRRIDRSNLSGDGLARLG